MHTILFLNGKSSIESYDNISLFSKRKFAITECNLLDEFEHKLLHTKNDGIMFDHEHLPDLIHKPNLVEILTSSTIPICCVQTNENGIASFDSNPIKFSYIVRTYKSPTEIEQDVNCFSEVVKNASSRNKKQDSLTETAVFSTSSNQNKLLQNLADFLPGMLFQFVRYPDGTMNCPYVSKGIESVFEIYEYNEPIEFEYMLSRIHPEDKESFIESIYLSIHNLSFWKKTYRAVLPKKGIRWFHASSQPQKFPDGKIVWHGYAYDVTDRKNAEAAMLRAQRIESIGTLASGVAHDLNNILTPIMTSSELLKLKITDEKLLRVLAIIETASKRGSEMVQQILSFTKGVEGKKVPINFHYLIQELTSLIKVSFPKNIKFESICDDNLPLIIGDYTQIEQVMLNLCVNSRDAMLDGGMITIHCKRFDVNNDNEYKHLNLKKGVYLQLNITDTGSGMTQEVKDRLFEPYFTTKEIGFGTGLGLPTVLSIITAHNGVINVISEIDKGTNFQIYLPSSNIEEVLDEIPTIVDFNAQGENAIIVDQEDTMREFTKKALEVIGFTVTEAKTGQQAVEKLSNDVPASILLITDLLIPAHDGVSIILEAKRLNPSVKIIAVSGLIDSNIPFPEYPDIIYLQKPYSTNQILTAVVELLKK